MLCTICSVGVTTHIDGHPTGNVWKCKCGEVNCRHFIACSECRTRNPARPINYSLEYPVNKVE